MSKHVCIWQVLCGIDCAQYTCAVCTEPTHSHTLTPTLAHNPHPHLHTPTLAPPTPTDTSAPTHAPHPHRHTCTHLHPTPTYTCTPPPHQHTRTPHPHRHTCTHLHLHSTPTHLILQQQLQIPLCCLDGFLWQFRVHLGSEGHHLLGHLPRQTARKVEGTTSS